MNQIQFPFPGVEMNGFQNRKVHNVEKQFPGCLGRMVNLFDLSTGVAGNRLLTHTPDGNGSSLSRSQSDVARMLSPPFGDHTEDKLVVPELRRTSSNKKANGTPMKTLIAQEMSKEVESKHNPPNVVAKLMGLDSLPRQQPNSGTQRSHSRGYSCCSLNHSGIAVECWEQGYGFSDKQVHCDGYWCQEQDEYKDVYEIWQQSQKTNYSRENSPHKGRPNDSINEKKMALIRQKFMEAKRLATDERLRESKEFQDALEVLSSNKELFLKFLQEPNSMFSQHLYDLQSIPPPPETKRITVLRPSKVVDNEKFGGSGKKSDKQAKKLSHAVQTAGWDKHSSGYSPPFSNQKVDEYPSQPTRIVVLKPSPGKSNDIKAVVSSSTPSPRILPGEHFCEEPEDYEARESREVAKEITRQMHENLMGHHRDETLLSSVFSNGYIGDDSSFNRSENEYTVGNLSDSEVMSPTLRHSWDYINRLGSPYSSSSFSHASCSPESSVCREAKKRLSERWAMMASNGSQEQKYIRRSSSTLGEMLALSDVKKSVMPEDKGSYKELEPRGSTSCLPSDLNKEECVGESPKNLLRSKSVPVSSTVYGARLNVEVSDPEAGKTQVPKEFAKAKSTKSSLRGKVSSLFFSKNKKSFKEKSETSQSKDESECAHTQAPLSPADIPGKVVDDASPCVNGSALEERLSPGLHGSSSKSPPDLPGQGEKGGMVSWEAGLSVARPVMPGNVSENQDQPSPISVLEPPFEEDDGTVSESCGNLQGAVVSLKSNLIDKSPPIESIARTLSWDDSCAVTASPYPLKPSAVSRRAEEEEQDWLFFVQTLLSVGGFDGEIQSDSFLSRWHSPESPLDPSLRDKYANMNEKELLQEAKRRQRRSNRKLVFDCVNAALVEITGYGIDRSTRAMLCIGSHDTRMEGTLPGLADCVWAQMKQWFSNEVKCGADDGGDNNSLVVERVVRKEVVGKGWVENLRLELDNVGKEIEGKLLEELVEEAVVDLTGGLSSSS